MDNNCEKPKSYIGIVLALISFIVFTFWNRYAQGNDIWYDEVFSLSFAEHGFNEITALTSRDVHPPLYYFYLKAFTSIVSSITGQYSMIIIGKIASLIPWGFLFLISSTYIKDRFGILTFGLFSLMVTVMPQLPSYYFEIRMYSLALLFITAEILISFHILTNTDKNNNLSWILFFITGILTAYTQYYACIAIIGSYIAVFLCLLFIKGQKKSANLIRLAICSVLSVVCYLPWLPVLKAQIENISGKYWIQPLTLRSIAGCVKFVVLPVVYLGKMPEISAGLLLIGIAILTVLFIRKGKRDDFVMTLCCLMPAFIVVLSGFILSALGTPIFVYRYLVPTLGGIWLLVALMAEKVIDKNYLLLLLVPILLVSILNIKGTVDEEGNKYYNIDHSYDVVLEVPKNSVIITNFDHVCAIMSYYRPDCSVLLYEGEIDQLLPDMLGNITDNVNDSDIQNLVKDNPENVYFWGSFNSREEIVASWEKLGISNELLDNILIERYWINVYKLGVR